MKVMADISFRQSTFNSLVQFSGTFAGDVKFTSARFEAKSRFDGTFEGETSFHQTVFRGKVTVGATFLGPEDVDFRVEYIEELDAKHAKFESGVTFEGVTFTGDVDIHAACEGDADFSEVTFEEHTRIWMTFEGDAQFQQSIFESGGNFRMASFNAGINFTSADVSNVSFRGVELDEAIFEKADLTDSELSDASLQSATLERALMNRTDLFNTDLRDTTFYGAVFGNAQINEETEFGSRCVYEHYYERSKEVGEALDFVDTDETSQLTKAAGQYRIIEQLARTNAFPDMVSHNFIRRQDIHREQHRQEGRWGRWLRATASKYVLEYGENPWRLITTGLIIVGTFGLLYPLVGGLQPTDGSPITVSRVIENPLLLAQSIYYSTLTFTTLGMGDFQPVGLGRALTTFETSLGAIIIALLVFVFGRRAAR